MKKETEILESNIKEALKNIKENGINNGGNRRHTDTHDDGYSKGNKLLSDFLRLLKRNLKSYFGFTRVGYLWVRELSTTDRQHYHLILLLDGNKVQHPKNVINIAEEVA